MTIPFGWVPAVVGLPQPDTLEKLGCKQATRKRGKTASPEPPHAAFMAHLIMDQGIDEAAASDVQSFVASQAMVDGTQIPESVRKSDGFKKWHTVLSTVAEPEASVPVDDGEADDVAG